MKTLKINLEDKANAEKLIDLLDQIKGIKSVEIIDEDNVESEMKKAFNKSKEQLKNGDYENIVNDIFDIFVNKK